MGNGGSVDADANAATATRASVGATPTLTTSGKLQRSATNGATPDKKTPATTGGASPATPAGASASKENRSRMRELGLLDSDDDDDSHSKAAAKTPKVKRLSRKAGGGGGGGDHTGSAPGASVKRGDGHLSLPRRNVVLFTGTTVGKWRKGKLIGKGATGAVYEAVDEATGGTFCVKEVEFAEDFADNPADRQRFEALRAEIDVLRAINHPNVVRFLGIDKIGFNMYIQMEYVNGGNLQDIIKQFGALSDDVAGKYTKQIVDGLCYLHDKNIIHRDIKGANLLITSDGVVKLADFGCSKRILDSEQLFKTLAGTPYWMAPEMVRQEGHNKAADVWSLGATVLQMVSGLAPYQLLPPVPALFRIGHGTDVPVSPDLKASPLVLDFMRRCLTRDAALRPTIHELRDHPWLKATTTTAATSAQQSGAASGASSSSLPSAPQPQPLLEAPSDANLAVPSATAEAVARREFLERNTGFEEEEIMEFILQLTARDADDALLYESTTDGGGGGDMAVGAGAGAAGAASSQMAATTTTTVQEPIDLEQFDDEHFDAFVSNLGGSADAVHGRLPT